tara:strand:- start:34 stop:300 length:267 start_codon:yes stop_codon:yes gene_type:complete
MRNFTFHQKSLTTAIGFNFSFRLLKGFLEAGRRIELLYTDLQIRCVTRAKARKNRYLDKFHPLQSQIGHKGDVKWEVFENEMVSIRRR